MKEALSQQIFLLARNTWGKHRNLLSFEDAVYGVLHSISVVQLAFSMFPAQFLRDPKAIPWAMLRELIAGRYPVIAAHGEALKLIIPSNDIQEFNGLIVKAFHGTHGCDPYILANLYIKLKEEYRVADIRKMDSKVVGKELLLRTQFFTEPYMVRSLIRKALANILDRKKLTVSSFPVIIDPAAGACNFLVGALLEGEKTLSRRIKGTSSYRAAIEALVESLVGYELDPLLAELGALSLDLVVASLTGNICTQRPKVFSGQADDELGFLYDKNCTDFFAALPGEKLKIILTNPPYLGRRMMGLKLKEHIKHLWPEAKGDLCAAFTLRCADIMRAGDILGIVHQNSLFHLSSLAAARTRLLGCCAMIDSINLGSGAFESLNGEKASVSLTVFQCEAQPKTTVVINLAKLNYAEKVLTLESGNFQKKHIATQVNNAFDNQNSTSFFRPKFLRGVLGSLETYGMFASPMQGTSTGDNRRAIRYSWEVPRDDSDWVSASKGGGYAKWWGLNRYVVWWGRAGERLKEIDGSALRNIAKQEATQLVFSDTGTTGLNVRCLKQGQVFIASGPGIHVKKGSSYAHLAFLNTRYATYCLRVLNPKLSVSPGYLKQLPFSEDIASNKTLSEAAKQCVELKQQILSTKLGSDDFDISTAISANSIAIDAYLTTSISRDLQLELDKLIREADIEKEVQAVAGLSLRDSIEIQKDVGRCAAELQEASGSIDLVQLDALFSRLISTSLHYRNGVKLPGGIAADGPLEAAALLLGRAPGDIAKIVSCKSDMLQAVRRIYLNDLLHKAVLHSLGFCSDRTWRENKVRIDKICAEIQDHMPFIDSYLATYSPDAPKIKSWIKAKLSVLHGEVFWGRPVLQLSDTFIFLKRPA